MIMKITMKGECVSHLVGKSITMSILRTQTAGQEACDQRRMCKSAWGYLHCVPNQRRMCRSFLEGNSSRCLYFDHKFHIMKLTRKGECSKSALGIPSWYLHSEPNEFIVKLTTKGEFVSKLGGIHYVVYPTNT